MTFADLVERTIVPFVDVVIIPLLYALAFLFFLVGVARYFVTESEEKRKEARQFALWGIIGLVVIFGVWGIVRIFLSILI